MEWNSEGTAKEFLCDTLSLECTEDGTGSVRPNPWHVPVSEVGLGINQASALTRCCV